MVVDVEDGEPPETNADVFRRLGSRGVLDAETAMGMAQAAGFRNVLSHRYGDDIDDEDVYNFLQENLPLFHSFLAQIRDYLADA